MAWMNTIPSNESLCLGFGSAVVAIVAQTRGGIGGNLRADTEGMYRICALADLSDLAV